MTPFWNVIFLVPPILLTAGSWCAAQNVASYRSMPDPYLLLLREPAVHEDLLLSDDERLQLGRLNDEIDGPLLSLRNWPSEKATQKMAELAERTRARTQQILHERQLQRLDQIMLRVRGIKLVLTPSVAERLKLTPKQTSQIEEIVKRTPKEIAELQKQLQDGEPADPIEEQAVRVQEEEQTRVLKQLTTAQRRQLVALLGRSFDPSRLGRVSFKAPELIDTGTWINSKPLRIADLRGQVTVLHFFAFG